MDRDLSDDVSNHIEQMFVSAGTEEAKTLLLQIARASGVGQGPSRCEIAALKISCGSIEKLKWAVDLYHIDYRDLLMSAEFGYDLTAHERWNPNQT